MGKKDTVTKEYIRNPVIFADIFNKFLYHGKQIIKPENLTERDITEIALPYGNDGAAVPEQRYRDALKLLMADEKAAYCVLGVEGQDGINYAMPVKNMLYDALQLAHQVTEASNSHRKEEKAEKGYKPSPDEYLTGFYKTDKLLPVVTIVLFFGAEKWDAPLTLKDMYSETDEAVMQYVPDYKVNLISPDIMPEEEIEEFKTNLREVMLYIKYSKNRKKLLEITKKDKKFRTLERQAAEVINITTNSKLHIKEGKEEIDMCLAIQEIMEDSKTEGKLEGIIEGTVRTYKEVGFSLQEAIQRISEKFNFSLQQSEETVKKYW